MGNVFMRCSEEVNPSREHNLSTALSPETVERGIIYALAAQVVVIGIDLTWFVRLRLDYYRV